MADYSNAQWRKSTRSGNGNNCVEVATNLEGAILVRDSKNPTGPALAFTPEEWKAFVGGIRDGEFNP